MPLAPEAEPLRRGSAARAGSTRVGMARCLTGSPTGSPAGRGGARAGRDIDPVPSKGAPNHVGAGAERGCHPRWHHTHVHYTMTLR